MSNRLLRYLPSSLKVSASATLFTLVSLLFFLRSQSRRGVRTRTIPPSTERVLVLGASSGVGRIIAFEYAKRGAKVCLVGRRQSMMEDAAFFCRSFRERGLGREDRKKVGETSDNLMSGGGVLSLVADIGKVDDMVRVREELQNNEDFKGIDTIILAAGVSSLRPLLSVAGLEPDPTDKKAFIPAQASPEGIQKTVDVATAAVQGNYIGPLITAVTFIPLLQSTSRSPSFLLMSSLAAAIPPPTRTLYSSTKAASLFLYQALSIEHPSIAFTYFLPSTIVGDFRASAVDGGQVREADPNKHGLSKEECARRCIEAVDGRERVVFLPGWMSFARVIYWIWPAFVERKARAKYGYTA